MSIKCDGRTLSLEKIHWSKIKAGDVVVHGFIKENNVSYITLTNVDGKYWEYYEDGYYKSTTPEFCHWKVVGQKNCGGGILKPIEYDYD